MTVSTIASIAAGLSRAPINTSGKAPAVLNGLVSAPGQPSNPGTPDAVASPSTAVTLQNQVAQFRTAAKDIAQASSLLSTAESGANQIATNLVKLKDLATTAASDSVSDDQRVSLDTQFQSIRAQSDTVAKTTSFNNETPLNTTAPVTDEDDTSVSISPLTDQSLFPQPKVSILNPSGARIALDFVSKAVDYTNKQVDTIKSLQKGLDFASGTVHTAIQNQDAANSTLNDADFAGVTQGGTISLAAQTNNLPGNILQLISE